MKNGFRQSMAWLHTWTGLLVGWLLLLIFMAGTASYYREEISRWMRPELPSSNVSIDVAAQRAVAPAGQCEPRRELVRHPAAAAQPGHADVLAAATGTGRPQPWRRGGFGDATLDPNSGQALKARETRGGDFFYRLHFDLHYIPVYWARYLVGFCAMFMLVAIITGVITHKKIFKDFFTFRKDKGLRSWLDFHNVSAVMALPYHAMITYTGIVTLMIMYLPGSEGRLPQDEDKFISEAFGLPEVTSPAEGRATPLPIAQLLDSARAHWHGVEVAGFTVSNGGPMR